MSGERIAFFLMGSGTILFLWCVRESWRQWQTERRLRYVRRVLERSRNPQLN